MSRNKQAVKDILEVFSAASEPQPSTVVSSDGSFNTKSQESNNEKVSMETQKIIQDTIHQGFNEAVSNVIAQNNMQLASELKNFLQDALSSYAISKVNSNLPCVYENIENYIKTYIQDNYGAIDRKVNLYINNDFVKSTTQIYHNKFESVCNCIANNIPVYLCGEAGTGKNVLAQQVAEALKLEFYYTNCITDEFQLKGFTTANGEYQETQFYKAFKNGGLYMLDELDASVPEALIILNSAIANGYFDFPAPIGKVVANENFRVIAAGNTDGKGSTGNYTARSIIDSASLDRFLFIQIDYDKNIELSLCENDKELIDFVNKVREIMKSINIEGVISYRSLIYFSKCKNIHLYETEKELLLNTIFKNINRKNILDICSSLCANSNKYNNIMLEVSNE